MRIATATAAFVWGLVIVQASHAAGAGPSQEQAENDRKTCFSLGNVNFVHADARDAGIEACTRRMTIPAVRNSPKALAAAYRARASWKNKKNDLDGALADFDESARLEPDNVETYDYRADVWKDKHNWDQAIANYDQAIRIDPSYAAAYYSRGTIYERQDNLARARADYNAAIAAPPRNRIADWAQRNAILQLGKLDGIDQAIATLTRRIQSSANDQFLYSTRGEAYLFKQDFDRAIADYSEALRLDPKYVNMYNDRGVAYARKGDKERAIADYSEAIRLDPKYTTAYSNRGLVKLYAGALPQALADLDRAAALAPKSAYAALWLDIAGQRNNVPSRLPQAISSIDLAEWPAPVIRMFLGQMTPAAVLAAADIPGAMKKKDQLCDAYFFSGEWALRQGTKDEAARLLKLAVSGCSPTSSASGAANEELKALGQAH
jgi:tetratricopeptide (TPR) repeat protein